MLGSSRHNSDTDDEQDQKTAVERVVRIVGEWEDGNGEDEGPGKTKYALAMEHFAISADRLVVWARSTGKSVEDVLGCLRDAVSENMKSGTPFIHAKTLMKIAETDETIWQTFNILNQGNGEAGGKTLEHEAFAIERVCQDVFQWVNTDSLSEKQDEIEKEVLELYASLHKFFSKKLKITGFRFKVDQLKQKKMGVVGINGEVIKDVIEKQERDLVDTEKRCIIINELIRNKEHDIKNYLKVLVFHEQLRYFKIWESVKHELDGHLEDVQRNSDELAKSHVVLLLATIICDCKILEKINTWKHKVEWRENFESKTGIFTSGIELEDFTKVDKALLNSSFERFCGVYRHLCIPRGLYQHYEGHASRKNEVLGQLAVLTFLKFIEIGGHKCSQDNEFDLFVDLACLLTRVHLTDKQESALVIEIRASLRERKEACMDLSASRATLRCLSVKKSSSMSWKLKEFKAADLRKTCDLKYAVNGHRGFDTVINFYFGSLGVPIFEVGSARECDVVCEKMCQAIFKDAPSSVEIKNFIDAGLAPGKCTLGMFIAVIDALVGVNEYQGEIPSWFYCLAPREMDTWAANNSISTEFKPNWTIFTRWMKAVQSGGHKPRSEYFFETLASASGASAMFPIKYAKRFELKLPEHQPEPSTATHVHPHRNASTGSVDSVGDKRGPEKQVHVNRNITEKIVVGEEQKTENYHVNGLVTKASVLRRRLIEETKRRTMSANPSLGAAAGSSTDAGAGAGAGAIASVGIGGTQQKISTPPVQTPPEIYTEAKEIAKGIFEKLKPLVWNELKEKLDKFITDMSNSTKKKRFEARSIIICALQGCIPIIEGYQEEWKRVCAKESTLPIISLDLDDGPTIATIDADPIKWYGDTTSFYKKIQMEYNSYEELENENWEDVESQLKILIKFKATENMKEAFERLRVHALDKIVKEGEEHDQIVEVISMFEKATSFKQARDQVINWYARKIESVTRDNSLSSDIDATLEWFRDVRVEVTDLLSNRNMIHMMKDTSDQIKEIVSTWKQHSVSHPTLKGNLEQVNRKDAMNVDSIQKIRTWGLIFPEWSDDYFGVYKGLLQWHFKPRRDPSAPEPRGQRGEDLSERVQGGGAGKKGGEALSTESGHGREPSRVSAERGRSVEGVGGGGASGGASEQGGGALSTESGRGREPSRVSAERGRSVEGVWGGGASGGARKEDEVSELVREKASLRDEIGIYKYLNNILRVIRRSSEDDTKKELLKMKNELKDDVQFIIDVNVGAGKIKEIFQDIHYNKAMLNALEILYRIKNRQTDSAEREAASAEEIKTYEKYAIEYIFADLMGQFDFDAKNFGDLFDAFEVFKKIEEGINLVRMNIQRSPEVMSMQAIVNAINMFEIPKMYNTFKGLLEKSRLSNDIIPVEFAEMMSNIEKTKTGIKELSQRERDAVLHDFFANVSKKAKYLDKKIRAAKHKDSAFILAGELILAVYMFDASNEIVPKVSPIAKRRTNRGRKTVEHVDGDGDGDGDASGGEGEDGDEGASEGEGEGEGEGGGGGQSGAATRSRAREAASAKETHADFDLGNALENIEEYCAISADVKPKAFPANFSDEILSKSKDRVRDIISAVKEDSTLNVKRAIRILEANTFMCAFFNILKIWNLQRNSSEIQQKQISVRHDLRDLINYLLSRHDSCLPDIANFTELMGRFAKGCSPFIWKEHEEVRK